MTLASHVTFRAKQPLVSGTFLTTGIMDGKEAQEKVMGVSFFFLSFVFSGSHLQHMDIPRLGVESEL